MRRREHGQRLEPLWMGRCKRPRNHAAPIVSDDMERLRANGVGDSKDIVHEAVWTIFSHVERSGAAGIATLVSKATARYPAATKASKLSRHQLENSGQPCSSTTTAPPSGPHKRAESDPSKLPCRFRLSSRAARRSRRGDRRDGDIYRIPHLFRFPTCSCRCIRASTISLPLQRQRRPLRPRP